MHVLLIDAYVLLLLIIQLHVLHTDQRFCLLKLNLVLGIYIYLFYIGKETLTVATEDDYILKKTIVTKKGTTTGTTYGYLMDDSLSLNVDISGVNFECYSCYSIENINDEDPFFLEGDSGSGVYLIHKYKRKPMKPLGIAFAFTNWQTAVCNINNIVDELGLQIVRYFENID